MSGNGKITIGSNQRVNMPVRSQLKECWSPVEMQSFKQGLIFKWDQIFNDDDDKMKFSLEIPKKFIDRVLALPATLQNKDLKELLKGADTISEKIVSLALLVNLLEAIVIEEPNLQQNKLL